METANNNSIISTFLNNLASDINSDIKSLKIVTMILYMAKKRPDFKDLSFRKIAIKFIIIPKPVEDKKLVRRYFLDLGSLII